MVQGDANDYQDAISEGSQFGSPQDTQIDETPTENATDNQNATEQPGKDELEALREENKRLRGTVSSLNRKYTDLLRQGVGSQSQATSGEGAYSDDVVSVAFDLANARVRDYLEREIIPFYDGTDPAFKNEPTLPPEDLSRIRANPLAFISPRTFKALFRAKTESEVDRLVEIAAREIEEIMAKRVDSLTTNAPKKGTMVRQVNPSPAPGVSSEKQINEQDLWSVPLEELEKMVPKARQNLLNQR